MPSPDTEPTIGTLYNVLDWSNVDRMADDWAKTRESPFQTTDFSHNFRLVLLDEALFGEPKPKADARAWLARAGVWEQIVRYLQDLTP